MNTYQLRSDKRREYFRGYDNVALIAGKIEFLFFLCAQLLRIKTWAILDTRCNTLARRWPRNRHTLHVNQKRHERRRSRSDYVSFCFSGRKSNCLQKRFFSFSLFLSLDSFRINLSHVLAISFSSQFSPLLFLDRILTVKVCQLAGNWLLPPPLPEPSGWFIVSQF